ncbi:MAG: hypothetical protein ACOVN9_07020 [Inhella sp.]
MSIRPITDTLRLLDGGAFIDRCSDELAALVKAVETTGKTGKLAITLDLKTVGNGAVQITPKVNASVPEPKPDTTLLWATVEGNLVVDNPAQQKLDLRAVEQRPTELKSAIAG